MGFRRFDGKKFENFTSRDNLASGGVISIIEDSLGYLWFGHIDGGISRFNGQKFEQAAFDSSDYYRGYNKHCSERK